LVGCKPDRKQISKKEFGRDVEGVRADTRRAARVRDPGREGTLAIGAVLGGVRYYPDVIAVTGLAFEARIAGGRTVLGDGLRNEARLREMISRGCRGIISFGVAGGLSPDLRPGQWVVASRVMSDNECLVVDAHWSQRILDALPRAEYVPMAGVDAPVADPSAKRALFKRTGASTVDMESHIAARIAAAYGLRFAACRVIIDPADRALPPAALQGLGAQGVVDLRGIMRSIMEQPSQLPELLRLALDASIAKATLQRGRDVLGPTFGFPVVSPLAQPLELQAASC
jgi:adenosylhomocysteine nucleosidase